jgi:hypothetical protein
LSSNVQLMTRLITTISFSILSFLLVAQKNQTDIFDLMNDFLIKEVNAGKVNYQGLKENPEQLNILMASIELADLTDKDKNYKMAFYLNAYNLTVIKQVVSNYPISSPLDIDGFFKKNKFKIAGDLLTLDELEFEKIMNPYRDSRVHFALGCAALSCPFLYDNAFRPEHVEEQLEFRAQLIIDRPDYVTVDKKKKIVTLNKIFEWYGDQFSYNAGSLINFINKYRFYKVPNDYQIQFYEYNWTLNERK